MEDVILSSKQVHDFAMKRHTKGITVEIGGDTTGLDKALKGVLALAINNTAMTKKYCSPRVSHSDNMRYSFRV